MRTKREAAIRQIQDQAKLWSEIRVILDQAESTLAEYVKDGHDLGLSFSQMAFAAGLDPDGVIDMMARQVPRPLLEGAG